MTPSVKCLYSAVLHFNLNIVLISMVIYYILNLIYYHLERRALKYSSCGYRCAMAYSTFGRLANIAVGIDQQDCLFNLQKPKNSSLDAILLCSV